MRNCFFLAWTVGVLGATSHAFAQDTEPAAPEASATKANTPQREHESLRHLKRPATMPAGVVQVFAPMQISLVPKEIGKPIFWAPNISWGVSDKVTLRLLHGEAYRAPDSVAGLCFTGQTGGCPNVYNNVSADAVVGLLSTSSFSLTANTGWSVSNTSSLSFGVMLGTVAEISIGENLAMQLEPSLLVALNRQSQDNPHRFGITARAFLQASKPLLVFSLLGLFSPFEDFVNRHVAPVGAGFLYALGPNVDLGLQLTFTNLLGAAASFDDRQLTILTAFRR